MGTSSTPPLDLRAIRTRFLRKSLAYALSYEYRLRPTTIYAATRDTILLRMSSADAAGSDGAGARGLPVAGEVFTVFDEPRVPGLDGLGHDTPGSFEIRGMSELVTLRWLDQAEETKSGLLEGRMIFESRTRRGGAAFPTRISVSYDGTLRLTKPIARDAVDGNVAFAADASITTFFEIDLPEYHWLTENGSIAFGTWNIKDGKSAATFDSYCIA